MAETIEDITKDTIPVSREEVIEMVRGLNMPKEQEYFILGLKEGDLFTDSKNVTYWYKKTIISRGWFKSKKHGVILLVGEMLKPFGEWHKFLYARDGFSYLRPLEWLESEKIKELI